MGRIAWEGERSIGTEYWQTLPHGMGIAGVLHLRSLQTSAIAMPKIGNTAACLNEQDEE